MNVWVEIIVSHARNGAYVATIACALAVANKAGAQAPGNFNLPEGCTNATGSVYNGDLLYDQAPPVVTLSFNTNSGTAWVESTVDQDATGHWFFTLPPARSQTYLVQIAYTPFLYSYFTYPVPTLMTTLPVPSPMTSVLGSFHLYASVFVTLYTDETQTTVMPGGFLEMAPQLITDPTAETGSPYAVQADANGVAQIDCFTALRNGNPGTVVSADGLYSYDVNYSLYATGRYP